MNGESKVEHTGCAAQNETLELAEKEYEITLLSENTLSF